MKLKFPFKDNIRWFWFDYHNYKCANCGGNGENCGGLEIHHILGRVSDSILNSIYLCKKCHNEVRHTQEEHFKYLNYTKDFVEEVGYVYIQSDIIFYQNNIHLYE